MIHSMGCAPRFGKILIDEAGRASYGEPAILRFELTKRDQENFKDLLNSGNTNYVHLELGVDSKSYSVKENRQEIQDGDRLNRLISLIRQAPLSSDTKRCSVEHLQIYGKSKGFNVTA